MTKSYTLEIPTSGNALGDNGSGLGPLDLKSLIGVVYRRFLLIVTGFLTTFGLIAFITFTQTPVYTAESVVQIDTTEKNVIDLGAIFSGVGGSTAVIDTEVLVVGSKSLLTRVAIEEKLVEEPEFNSALKPVKRGPLTSLSISLKRALGDKTAGRDPLEGLTADERADAALGEAVGWLMSKVSVSRVGTTYLITIKVESESPQTAARLANAIAEQYRVQQLEQKLDQTRKATEWLSSRVSGLRDEVEEKERRVETFRAETGLLAAQGATLTEQQIAYMTAQKGALEIELGRARARYDDMRRQMSGGGTGEGLSDVINSQLISELKSQRAVVMRRVADLETRLGPAHPELMSARSEAADIDRQISAETSRVATNVENDLKVAQSQIATIQAEINRSTGQLRGNNINLVRLRELERDAETSRVIYEEFIARSKQTREQDALLQADANVLSTASVPHSPSSPKTLLNLIIACLLGGVIGGGLALIAEMFDMKLSSTEDVERKLGANPIGSVPLIKTANFLGLGQINPADFLVENPLSAYAESIRYLRAAIAFSDLDSETKTVAISSSLPDEGKTSLTLSLGRMSAMSGARTLVIDGDFRRRQLTEVAGLKPEIGFIEHLFGAGQLSDAITKDRKSTLDILPLSQSGHTPHDVFGTRAFDDLMTRLRSMYDLILIDTGPLLLMAEARVVAGKVDKTILVVRWRSSQRSAARQSLALLRAFNADVLGVTLNMVDLNRRRHHRDPGTAYKAYRKYYQMDSRPSLFGWSKSGKRKSSDKEMPRPAAISTPPSKAVQRTEKADRMPAD